ncbi:hypothetical protein QT972_01480 [Microcoleus sp. herbarium7]|uniref:hypothetical protein n=1 Tax=Microcoleus sp. herbarium7 TaxID=3055435 RepID=UPI002FD71FA3
MKKNQLAVKVLLPCLGLALTFIISNNFPVAAQNTPSNSPAPAQQQTTTAAPQTAKPAESPKPSLKSPPSVDKPTEVSLGFSVLNLGRINQTDETFDVSGFLYATWQDKRLAFDPKAVGDQVVRYTPEQVWEPALTIFNSQSAAKRGTVQLTAKPDGTVNYLELVNATVSSALDLRKFPFDSQTAQIIWEPLSSDAKGIVLQENQTATGYSKDAYVSLSEWQILGINTEVTTKKAEKEDKTYPRYTFEIKVKRNFQFYIFKVFLPLLLITVISWTTFWINPSTAFVPQMNVGITSILTAITFNFTVANALPRVSYLTLMDAYIFICYIFFFSSIMATVTCHFLLNYHKKPEVAVGMLRKFRWIFPAAFIVSQATAMAFFLLG